MCKTAAVMLLLALCLSGCSGKEPAQESPNVSPEPAERSPSDTLREAYDDIIGFWDDYVIHFLESHVELRERVEQEGLSYMVSRGIRDDASVGYFIVSIGKNSAEKFTAMEHYYIRFDFCEIIQANPAGRDIVVWAI